MIKKICFSVFTVFIFIFITIGIYEYSDTSQVLQSTNEEQTTREDLVPFNFANFRSFDLIIVIVAMATATTGISSVLLVKKEGEKDETKQII